jgi:hypothetical protein
MLVIQPSSVDTRLKAGLLLLSNQYSIIGYHLLARCAQAAIYLLQIVAFPSITYLFGCSPTHRYTYYFVSLHTKNIWWKSSLTMCQMIQFSLMIIQAVMILFKSCGTMPPKRVVHMYFYYIFSLLFLFANFFIKSYVTGSGGSKKAAKTGKKTE